MELITTFIEIINLLSNWLFDDSIKTNITTERVIKWKTDTSN